MALELDATPLSPTCNSYASLADAAEYVSTRVSDADLVTTWEDLDADVQAQYLVNASRSLDAMCTWIGDRYSGTQGLKWPRYNAFVDGYLLDSITFPVNLVAATIEMALWALTNSGAVKTTSNAQFDSIKVGPIAIDFNEGAGVATNSFYPDIVAILLQDLGGIAQPNLPSNNMMKVVRLVRT